MARRRRQKNEPFLTAAVLGVLVILGGAASLPDSNSSNNALVAAVLALLTAVALVVASYVGWQEQRKRLALRALTEADVAAMSGVDFERYVGMLMRSQGYQIIFTPQSGDYGVDIIASKDGVKTAVQTKRYSFAVNQDAIRQSVAGVAYYKCDNAMVVTNNYYTKAARRLAASNGCQLVDGVELGDWIRQFRSASRET